MNAHASPGIIWPIFVLKGYQTILLVSLSMQRPPLSRVLCYTIYCFKQSRILLLLVQSQPLELYPQNPHQMSFT